MPHVKIELLDVDCLDPQIEDLNINGMMANHKLTESAISDLGFYEFRRMLEYKQAFYGFQVELVDRWFPSSKTCSSC